MNWKLWSFPHQFPEHVEMKMKRKLPASVEQIHCLASLINWSACPFPVEPGVPLIHPPSFPMIPTAYGVNLWVTFLTFVVIKWFPFSPCPDLPSLIFWGLGTMFLTFLVIVTELVQNRCSQNDRQVNNQAGTSYIVDCPKSWHIVM